ncbi:hypothetical protein EDB83DRAFT_2319031 [Lactarius deliciosus]|nr:hypothetical protein EDB83DRAFT_2319031 [Lactarius deliciosus]
MTTIQSPFASLVAGLLNRIPPDMNGGDNAIHMAPYTADKAPSIPSGISGGYTAAGMIGNTFDCTSDPKNKTTSAYARGCITMRNLLTLVTLRFTYPVAARGTASANFLAFEVGGVSTTSHDAAMFAACLQIPELMTRVRIKWDLEGQIWKALAKELIP